MASENDSQVIFDQKDDEENIIVSFCFVLFVVVVSIFESMY